MLVAFLSLLNGTSPTTCLMKAAAAFLVFAGVGRILRYVLTDFGTDSSKDNSDEIQPPARNRTSGNLDVIVPGTSVADLLGSGESDED